MKLCWSLHLSTIFLTLLLDGRPCEEIIDGNEAKPHSRPYMAFIKLQNKGFCGGTLINPHWVLTAAHCNIKNTAEIILGAHSILFEEKEKQFRNISRVIIHEHYKENSFNYDVALLKFAIKAKLTDAVKSLLLPKSYDEPVRGEICEVAGWGVTEKEKPSDKLMETNVTIIDRTECKAYWKDDITENMICTREKSKKETCAGDSGGPLICNGILRGIISFGNEECGIPGNVAVYTNLNKEIIYWIQKQIGDLP